MGVKSHFVPDITPETHPDHHTVGWDFMGYSLKHKKAQRYHCYSHDKSGYNLVNRGDPTEFKNVSERAIGRTFHEIYKDDHGEWSQWGRCWIDGEGLEIPKKQVV